MPTRGSGGERKNPKMSGIDFVSDRMRTGRLKIVRCPETLPLIQELGLYRYDPAKLSEEPIDVDNHACDGLRYQIVGHDRGRFVGSAYPVETVKERETQRRPKKPSASERPGKCGDAPTKKCGHLIGTTHNGGTDDDSRMRQRSH